MRIRSRVQRRVAAPLLTQSAEFFAVRPAVRGLDCVSLNSAHYAENDAAVSTADLPVFVTVMHAHSPTEAALATEVLALTTTIAQVTGRPAERVHVEYAPPGAGRQAFGGQLVK